LHSIEYVRPLLPRALNSQCVVERSDSSSNSMEKPAIAKSENA
jgi:hypothetical protein